MSQNEYADVAAQVTQYRELTAQIEALTKARDEVKDQIITIMDANRLEVYTGENFTIRYKPYERTTFDSKAFAKAYPALYNEFTKTSVFTRFTVV